MESAYYVIFTLIACGTAVLELSKASSSQSVSTSSAFTSFRTNYVFVYTLMMAGDWLQGPYVYALYSYYGFDVGSIGRLFIAGFGSSMVFGTIVGSLADKFGRRKASLLYVATYIASCITKHSPNFWVLMLGRVFGGIATSLLFSAFESWLVAEHFKRGYESDWLSGTFSKAVFFGNGLAAIVAGLLANTLVHSLDFGPVAPFDAAIVVLAIGGTIIMSTWTENYGDNSQGKKDMIGQFKAAASTISKDPKIALLGALQSLFEGSMYTFVFLWTPALSPSGEDIPHGFIFATFMVSCMAGSSIAAMLLAKNNLRPESYMQIVFGLASLSLLTPVIIGPGYGEKGGPMPVHGYVKLIGFCVFELCVGIFWPSLMKMRASYIPEESRSTIMNFFRIPLNLFVCIVLYNVDMFPLSAMFCMCAAFLLVALAAQRNLALLTSKLHRGASEKEVSLGDTM